jgi:hypothetical protein
MIDAARLRNLRIAQKIGTIADCSEFVSPPDALCKSGGVMSLAHRFAFLGAARICGSPLVFRRGRPPRVRLGMDAGRCVMRR